MIHHLVAFNGVVKPTTMNNDFEDLEKLVYGLFAGAAVLIGLIGLP
jgi:hypothetical protein